MLKLHTHGHGVIPNHHNHTRTDRLRDRLGHHVIRSCNGKSTQRSAVAVLGYLLTMISISVFAMTGQLPWILLIAPIVVALVLLLPN